MAQLWADSSLDSSHTQGTNNFFYGYTDGNPSHFTLFTTFNPDNIWNGGWALCAPSTQAPCVDSNNVPISNLLASPFVLHPEGATGTSAQVVWESEVTANVSVTGLFGGNEFGGGTTQANIFLNGNPIYEHLFIDNRNIDNFSLAVNLHVGDKLAFAVSAPTGNSANGSTGYYFQVWGPESVPLPPTAGLLLTGALALAAFRRRKFTHG